MNWEPYPKLDNEQLHALGHLTWEAIKLEGVIDRVCELLVKGSTAKGHVSNHVERVTKSLANAEVSAGQTGALSWLQDALDALLVRNATLHSKTEIFHAEVNGLFVQLGPVQLVNENKTGTTRTDLTALGLLAHANTLHRAYLGWRKVEVDLVLER